MSRAGIGVGVGGGLLVALMLAPATGDALGDLVQARTARAAAQVQAYGPKRATPPLLGGALRISAASDVEAGRAVVAQVRGLAAQGGVLVEQAEPVRAGGGLARVRLRFSGSDKAVVALLDRLEREAPLVRLRDWQVVAIAGGGLRVQGEAVAAWR